VPLTIVTDDAAAAAAPPAASAAPPAAWAALAANQPPPPPEPPNVAPPEDDGRVPVTVRLTPFHFQYLEQRARLSGETPERALETILRVFRAQHDQARHGLNTAPRGPGEQAGTSRRA
jgi:hypothetical protein